MSHYQTYKICCLLSLVLAWCRVSVLPSFHTVYIFFSLYSVSFLQRWVGTCIVGNIPRNIRCLTKYESGCRITISFVSVLPKKVLVLKVMIYWYSFFKDCAGNCWRRLQYCCLWHASEWRLLNSLPGQSKMLQAVSTDLQGLKKMKNPLCCWPCHLSPALIRILRRKRTITK